MANPAAQGLTSPLLTSKRALVSHSSTLRLREEGGSKMDVLRLTAIPCFLFFSVHERGVGGLVLQQPSQKRTIFLPLLGFYVLMNF